MKNSQRKYCQYLIDFYTSADVQEYFDDFERFIGPLPQESKILDLGCGIGHFSHRLIQKGYEVISLDINDYALHYGKKRGWINQAIAASCDQIPQPDRSFDCVFFLDVVEHLPQPEAALKEIKRVMKTTGKLFLITPNAFYGRLFGDKGEIDPTHVHEFGWWELKKILQKNGFKIIQAQASGLPLVNRLSHRLSRKMAKIFGPIVLPIASPSFWIEAAIKKGKNE